MGRGYLTRISAGRGKARRTYSDRLSNIETAVSAVAPGVGHLGRRLNPGSALGYLERTSDSTDRRANLILLSERGREITRVAEGIIANIEAAGAQRIGQEGRTELRGRLIDLIIALGA